MYDEGEGVAGANSRAARRGLSRRDLIKASAIAGVGAWSAPVIIDSIMSPAAAQSGVLATGSYAYVFLVTYNTGACTALLQPSNCTPTSSCVGTQGQVGPGDPGASLITASFFNCASNPPNQGICWSTSQGTFTGGGLSASSCVATGNCFGATSGSFCAAGQEAIPNNSVTTANGTQFLISLRVAIP